MLNEQGQRELAYVVTIDNIEPIVGSDNCEAAYVGGWHIMVRKNTFVPGDVAVYFEIDSHLDTNKPEFAFLEKKHGNIKTQKYTFGGKGNFISQGLLMSFSDFGWEKDTHKVGDFLTKELEVTYSMPEDNVRKSSGDKYKSMASRHPSIFKTPWARWLMRHNWGRKLMFFFFGKKSDKKSEWPKWVVKTDEERIQNIPWIVGDPNQEWIAIEKIDGTSTTFTMRRKGRKLYICSRNIVFDNPKKNCYYDTNFYVEMAGKYQMEDILNRILNDNKELQFITIQAETYGESVQKRDYGMKGRDMAVFNVILGHADETRERLNPIAGSEFAKKYGLPYVPVLGSMHLPTDCEGVLALAGGTSKLDGGMREGIVFRSVDGVQSFKAVDNEFLLKYHG